jgi:hypothetical protein
VSKKLRTVIRAAYIIALLVLTLLSALHGLGDVPRRAIAALSAIDPFFFTKDIGQPIKLCEALQGSSLGIEPCEHGWIALFHQGGWVALLLVGGPIIAFRWFMSQLKKEMPKEEVVVGIIFFVGLLLTGAVSFGLIWLLIGVTYAFGEVGFVSWIGLNVIGAIEAFFYVHDLVKSDAEAKEAIKEIDHAKNHKGKSPYGGAKSG